MDEAQEDKMMLWLVVSSGGGTETSKAFFNEDNARHAAGQMAGVGDRWVNLKGIEIEDRPR